MNVRVLCMALAFCGAGPACAAEWALQPAQSTLEFSGTQTGASFSGAFTRWTAQISFDPANPKAAHIKIIVDTSSAKTGDVQRDTAIPDGDWFNSAVFPQAVFEAVGFTPGAAGNYSTLGVLTIRGVTRKVNMPFTLALTGDTAIAKGQVSLLRTDYGVGQGIWSTGDWVALKVGINFVLPASKQQ